VLGEEGLPPHEKPWYVQAVRHRTRDRRRRLDPGCRYGRNPRWVAPIPPVSSPSRPIPAGAVYRPGERLRRHGFTELITLLTRTASLRQRMSHAHVVDLLFVLLGPPLYRSVVIESGWAESNPKAGHLLAVHSDAM
jgi:hypothetical protein